MTTSTGFNTVENHLDSQAEAIVLLGMNHLAVTACVLERHRLASVYLGITSLGGLTGSFS
jgi:hypothetical protein